MKALSVVFGCMVGLLSFAQAQRPFGDACLGTWTGTMYIYRQGAVKDSVPVRHTVARTADPNAWTWKTEYLSPKHPVVKDYVLRLKDPAKGIYVTDEGNGIELADHLFGNKLYSVFETQGIVLTATYELSGNQLIFEVTSGRKQAAASQEVTTFSVDNLQRVVFRR
ncbi:hypothetical protein [Nibrella viscosa]